MPTAAYIAVVLSTLWIDYGWRPLETGGHEYIIQVQPELIDTLRTEGIESYVPPEVRDIRRIRITVGSGTLPQTAGTGAPQAPNQVADIAKPDSDNSPSVAKQSTANRPDAGVPAEAPGAEARTAKYLTGSVDDGGDEGVVRAESQTPGFGAGPSFFGLDALVLAEIGLGIAGALILFLGCIHLSMRARYRALLHQVHDGASMH